MRFSSRHGIELAASTLVMLIVGIVILVSAGTITYRAYCSAEGLTEQVDASTSNRIEQLLSGGGKVEVADNTKEAEARGSSFCGRDRVRTAEFVVGIKNTYPTAVNLDLTIQRTVPEGMNYETDQPELQIAADSLVTIQDAEQSMDPTRVSLDAGELTLVKVLVTLPLQAQGQHVYTVVARNGETIYGAQQVYLSTP